MPAIRTLELFLAVARGGSFAAAGQQVGLTPAAVGQQMRALEVELGRPLFDRGARAVALNAGGRAMVGGVEDLLARYAALAAPAPSGDAGLAGSLQVGALVSALMGRVRRRALGAEATASAAGRAPVRGPVGRFRGQGRAR
jgi:DNA-binding transcriptional LysR family regulator